MIAKPNDERFIRSVEIWIDTMPSSSVPREDRPALLYLIDAIGVCRRLQKEIEQLESDKQELIEKGQETDEDVANSRWP